MKKLFAFAISMVLINATTAQNMDIAALGEKNIAVKKVLFDTISDTVQWLYKGMTGVNVAQAGFKNWSAGGENSFSTNGYFNATVSLRKNHAAWDNDFSLEYGVINTDQQGWRKNVDKIDISSKYGYAINKKLFYAALVNFNSQFSKGYNYPNDSIYISKFMAPGYVIVAIGMDYKPIKPLSIYASLATGRFTFVLDDSLSNIAAYGVDAGKKLKTQIGAYTKFFFHNDIMTNVNLKTKLELFTPYDNTFGNIDVNWEILLGMKINKYLTATLSATLKYDNNAKYIDEEGNEHGPRIQLKELLGVGLSYKF